MAKFELSPGVFVGEGCPTYVIAEGGINHNGQMDLAKQLCKVSKENGADCVKFQKRTIHRTLCKAGLDKPYTGPQSFGPTYREHKLALELSPEQWDELKAYCQEIGIPLMGSGWDHEAIDMLDNLGVPFFKMASADLNNHPLLEYVAKKGKPMIISTGMANMEQVKAAYDLVTKYNKKIVILQCTSTYPLDEKDVHLNVIQTYKKEFPEAVIGYSGHEKGLQISLAAVALGAKVIERHVTLDRTMKGGDHAASLEPSGLQRLVRDIRVIEDALGGYEKKIQESEKGCIVKLTKSVVSACAIKKGTVLTEEMLDAKSPGTGILPSDMPKIIGKKVTKDIDDDIVITWEDIEN